MANTYYVSSSGGSDSNSGTSISSPWQNMTKLYGLTFSAGDTILFKRGEQWNTSGHLSVTSDNVYIGAYGSGPNPVINVVSVTGDKLRKAYNVNF